MTDALVPASILSDPDAAKRRVAFIAGVAAAGAGLAGIFLRFDDGVLIRLSIAFTSAIFGALVVFVALSARETWGAIGRALGLSTVFGMVSTVLPSMILASHDSTPFAAFLIVGAFFGSFTGFVYGLVLAAVAGLTWKDVAAQTHDGADRAMRTAGVWALFPGLLSTWIATGYDARRQLSEWASEADRNAYGVAVPLGVIGAGLTIAVALAFVIVARRRLRRRSEWLSKVALGPSSQWTVRALGPHDDLTKIPRLRDGFTVLEHRDVASAYRTNATGQAVAVI